MHQSYAAICLISTRKVPRHGLDFRVTASLKSQCRGARHSEVHMQQWYPGHNTNFWWPLINKMLFWFQCSGLAADVVPVCDLCEFATWTSNCPRLPSGCNLHQKMLLNQTAVCVCVGHTVLCTETSYVWHPWRASLSFRNECFFSMCWNVHRRGGACDWVWVYKCLSLCMTVLVHVRWSESTSVICMPFLSLCLSLNFPIFTYPAWLRHSQPFRLCNFLFLCIFLQFLPFLDL